MKIMYLELYMNYDRKTKDKHNYEKIFLKMYHQIKSKRVEHQKVTFQLFVTNHKKIEIQKLNKYSN